MSYRLPLADPPAEARKAFCPWCKYSVSVDENEYPINQVKRSSGTLSICMASGHLTPWGAIRKVQFCNEKNKNGECQDYTPNLWTRFLEALGIREPKSFLPQLEEGEDSFDSDDDFDD